MVGVDTASVPALYPTYTLPVKGVTQVVQLFYRPCSVGQEPRDTMSAIGSTVELYLAITVLIDTCGPFPTPIGQLNNVA